MALVKCPECNREVSIFTTSCPNCGYNVSEHFDEINRRELASIKREERISRIEPPKPYTGYIVLGVLVIIAIAFLAIMALICENTSLFGIALCIDIFILLFLICYYCDKKDKYEKLKKDPIALRKYQEQVYQERIENRRNKIPKKKSTAILLCCLGFLGLGGIHYFYEGKIFMGLLYLFTGGMFGLGTIVDLIGYAKTPDIYYV